MDGGHKRVGALELELLRWLESGGGDEARFISIRELANRFGVSIHTMRETTQRLCAVGLLELRCGRLVRVAPHLERSSDNLHARLRAAIGGPRREEVVREWYDLKRDLAVLALARCARVGVDRGPLLDALWDLRVHVTPVWRPSEQVDRHFEVLVRAVEVSGSAGARLTLNSLRRSWPDVRAWELLALDASALDQEVTELLRHLEAPNPRLLVLAFERHHPEHVARVLARVREVPDPRHEVSPAWLQPRMTFQ